MYTEYQQYNYVGPHAAPWWVTLTMRRA